MNTEKDFALIEAPPNHIDRIAYHASIRINQLRDGTANLKSNVREDEDDRSNESPIEKCLQVAGEYSLHVLYYGYELGIKLFDELRTEMNDKPRGDDGGSDIKGFQSDVKTSRYEEESNLDITGYRLAVTKREKKQQDKKKGIFVFGACREGYIDFDNGICKCELCGFAYAYEMNDWIDEKDNHAIFKNKWVRPVWRLRPMISLPDKTHWKENKLGLITL